MTRHIFKIASVAVCLLVAGCVTNRNNATIPANIGQYLEAHAADKVIIPICILGSGPAGCSAAAYGARSNVTTVAFTGDRPGGLLTLTSDVENWIGIKKNSGQGIMENVRTQAEEFGAIFVDNTIDQIDLSSWPFKLHTESGATYYALSLVVATGANPNLSGVPGEQEYFGRGVGTCARCDKIFYKGKDVVIVGGGDSAIEEATEIASHASKVTILVRKEKMRASPNSQDKLKNFSNISVIYNVEVTKINGDGSKVVSVDLYNNKDKTTQTFKTDGMFLAIGHKPNTDLFKGKLAMNENGYILLEGQTHHTSVRGVFAAGDCHDHHYRQAVTASGFGAAAGIEASRFLEHHGFNAQVQAKFTKNIFAPKKADSKASAAHEAIIHLTTPEEFKTHVLEAKKPVVVDFYADYCPSCMAMLPAYQEIAQEHPEITWVKVDHSQATELADSLKITKLPAILVYDNGSLAARFSKALSKKELTDLALKYKR